MRRRHGLSQLRNPSSDRPLDSVADLQLDNSWRAELADLISSPMEYNLPWAGNLPATCVLALDETPLCYLPRSKTYVWNGQQGNQKAKEKHR